MAPRTRNSIAVTVLPQPALPHNSVGRPRGRPPSVIWSSPIMPVGHFSMPAFRESFVACVAMLGRLHFLSDRATPRETLEWGASRLDMDESSPLASALWRLALEGSDPEVSRRQPSGPFSDGRKFSFQGSGGKCAAKLEHSQLFFVAVRPDGRS